MLCFLPALLLAACTPDAYHTRADRDTYAILYDKSEQVENVDRDSVDITPAEPISIEKWKKTGSGASFLGKSAEDEQGSRVLPMPDALATSVKYGRDYLTEKERVFLSALDLTLARHRLTPIFNARGLGLRSSDSRTAVMQQGMTDLVATNTFARNQSAGFDWLLATGARVSTSFTQDFLRFMTGDRSLNRSDLAVVVAQPLLQGGGTLVTLEALTQEERNVLYGLRSFSNYRREFIVDVVSGYYGVLVARDQVQNNHLAYQGFLKNVEREEALGMEGLSTTTQSGQLKQAALQAESRWINSIRTYQTRLDNFKVLIGVPVDSRVRLDDNELKKLKIEKMGLTKDEAVRIALVTRPDLVTAADRVEDAERHIKVAKNRLLPGLDVSVQYDGTSDPGDTTPGLSSNRRRWAGSVDVDLPLDRKSQRNGYRNTMLQLERAKRSLDLSTDRVKLQIYEDWRALDQAERNFQIAQQGVNLAALRLEHQVLLAELGRGEARDLVDTQNDLVDAQNQRTSTLVEHTLARLRLWRDMGILYVNSDGSWVEKLEAEAR